MKAWRVVRHGAPSAALALEEVALPEPGPGQLRVRVATTVCNYNEVDGCYGRYLTVNPPLDGIYGHQPSVLIFISTFRLLPSNLYTHILIRPHIPRPACRSGVAQNISGQPRDPLAG